MAIPEQIYEEDRIRDATGSWELGRVHDSDYGTQVPAVYAPDGRLESIYDPDSQGMAEADVFFANNGTDITDPSPNKKAAGVSFWRQKVAELRKFLVNECKANQDRETVWHAVADIAPGLNDPVLGWHEKDEVREWVRRGFTTDEGEYWECWLPNTGFRNPTVILAPSHWRRHPPPPEVDQ